MALLIDGYNLLHVSDIFGAAGPGTELHRSRMALLDFLVSAIPERERRQTTIVFDATGAPPGLPVSMKHGLIQVHFARRHTNADEMIEKLLDECRSPKSLTVVSSDHRIQRAARHHGAAYIDSDQWIAELRAVVRERQAAEENARPKSETHSAEEIAYWVDEFAKDPTDKKKRGK